VTKSKGGVLWVEEAPTGNIRAGTCQATPARIFRQVVEAVSERGLNDKWGNVHPFTLKGVKDALDHLNFYDFTDMEVLVSRLHLPKHVLPKGNPELDKAIEEILGKHDEGGVDQLSDDQPEWLNPKDLGVPIRPCLWLPKNCAVVVPADRSYVGELVHIGGSYVAAVVYNSCRGMAFAKGSSE